LRHRRQPELRFVARRRLREGRPARRDRLHRHDLGDPAGRAPPPLRGRRALRLARPLAAHRVRRRSDRHIRAGLMIRERGLTPADRPAIASLLASLDAFTEDERAVALELVDARLARPEADDYRFVLAMGCDGGAEKLAGYLCYGRTPMTR